MPARLQRSLSVAFIIAAYLLLQGGRASSTLEQDAVLEMIANAQAAAAAAGQDAFANNEQRQATTFGQLVRGDLVFCGASPCRFFHCSLRFQKQPRGDRPARQG